MFEAHMIEFLEHVFEEANLSLIRGRKVRVPAFGTVGKISGFIPGEERLSEPRTWRNHPDGPFGDRLPHVDRLHIARAKYGDGMGNRLEIVHEVHRLPVDIQFLGERVFFHHPRQVGGFYASPDDGAGHREAGPIDGFFLLRQELLHDRLQAWKIGARHPGLRQGHQRPSLVREDCQVCFRSTDIASNEHCRFPFFSA